MAAAGYQCWHLTCSFWSFSYCLLQLLSPLTGLHCGATNNDAIPTVMTSWFKLLLFIVVFVFPIAGASHRSIVVFWAYQHSLIVVLFLYLHPEGSHATHSCCFSWTKSSQVDCCLLFFPHSSRHATGRLLAWQHRLIFLKTIAPGRQPCHTGGLLF